MSTYLISLLILVAITGINGLALNLQWGLMGVINFGLFGFYMIGAYVCAQLAVAGWSPWIALPAAAAAAAAASVLVGLISVRLSEDYLAIVTLGFAEVLKLVAIHEERLTRGSLGIPDIPRPVDGDGVFLIFSLGLLLLVFILFEVIARSPIGRAARALRDDPLVAATLGKNVLSLRLRLFAAGGAALGAAGSLHAFYYSYIDPTQFGPAITAYAFIAVIIGGRGSNPGVLLSSTTVIMLIEGTRFLNGWLTWFSPAQLAAMRLMLVGVALILVLTLRPQGFLAEYRLRDSRDHARTLKK